MNPKLLTVIAEIVAEPGRFIFYENWTSREALDRHLASPHLAAFDAAAADLVAEPPRILTCTRIS